MKPRNGIFYADFYLSNGKRVRRSLSAKGKAEAQRQESELMVQMEGALRAEALKVPVESSPVVRGITLKDAFTKTLKHHEPWRTSKSPRTIETTFEAVVKHFGPKAQLHEVATKAAIREFVDKLIDAGKSPSTINQRLSLLSVIFKWAEDQDNLAVKVTRPKMPRMKVRAGRKRSLTVDEEAAVVSLFAKGTRPKHGDMADLVVVLVDTGLRLSEALRMTDQQLGIRDEWLATRKNSEKPRGFTEVDLENHAIIVWDAKADNPEAVPMTERVHSILTRRAALGWPFGMLTVDSADDCWVWVRKEMGLAHDKDFVIHALRHTTATRLARITKGNVAKVQRYMRHKNVKTTLGYIHLAVEDLRGMASDLEGVQNVPKSVPKVPLEVLPQDVYSPPKRGSPKGFRPDERTGFPVRTPTVNPQVPGSSPGRGAKL